MKALSLRTRQGNLSQIVSSILMVHVKRFLTDINDLLNYVRLWDHHPYLHWITPGVKIHPKGFFQVVERNESKTSIFISHYCHFAFNHN